jgi:hypothetical protein
MKAYAAIDLHSNNSVLSVIDEKGTPASRASLPQRPAAVDRGAGALPQEARGGGSGIDLQLVLAG